MTAVCPNGHDSSADDYCDVCGAPIDPAAVVPGNPLEAPPGGPAGGAAAAPDVPASTGTQCPNCGTDNVADALFCEACGYDFTTGTLPRSADQPAESPAPAPEAPPAPAAPAFTHVAEVWVDPEWYAAQESPDPMPSPGLPAVTALRTTSLLVGRPSRSRNIHPDVDCEPDAGVSRRQAQLTTDGTRWWVEDLDSANGTFIGAAGGALPDQPIPVGVKSELQAGDRIFVGAWTKIVIRPVTDDEVGSLG